MAVVLIPRTDGTIITDALSTWANVGAGQGAFDGTTNQTEANSSAANAHGSAPVGTNYIGKDWGAAVTHKVTQIKCYGPNNNSLLYGGGGTGTATLAGSNDGSAWTTLDTFNCDGTNSQVVTRTSATINTTTAYRYHRISATGDGVAGCGIAEFELYEDAVALPTGGQSLSLPQTSPAFPLSLRTWTQSYNPNLIGKDRFFGLAGHPNFDWPLPRGPVYPISLRTHIDPMKILLRGQDRFYDGPGRAPVFDWPNPRGPQYPVQLRTWTWSFNLNLIGKDQFFGLGGRPTFDWPLPRGPVYPVSLRTWLQGFNPLLYASPAPTPAPFSQTDWPIPRGRGYPLELRAWAQSLAPFYGAVIPLNQDEWRLPPGRARLDSLYSWVQSPPLPLGGVELHAQPFINASVGFMWNR